MVKRTGNLMPRIASMDNLQEAFLRASRGKSGANAVTAFRKDVDKELSLLRKELLCGSYHLSGYHFFTIYDPKKRTICAADFRDRIVFHAMMRICHPVFDNYQMFDSYASRIGKDTCKALERAQLYAKRYQWYAKLDVCKYFDSIHHDVLASQLGRLFKDRQLMLCFRDIIDSYEASPQRGLPIGNLTSQYFANHYLSVADHHAKERLQVKALVRYMDDVLMFDDDKGRLKARVEAYSAFVEESLRLTLHPMILNQTSRGIPFLGYVVYPSCLRLNGRSKHRFRKKLRLLKDDLLDDKITQGEYAARATCLFAFIRKADVDDYIYKTANIKGMYP